MIDTKFRPGPRGAIIRITAKPCARCGDFRRYVSRHCVGCTQRVSREQGAREREYAHAGSDEHRDWRAIEAKLMALGRCACGLLLPCSPCPRSAVEMAEQRSGDGHTYPESNEL